MVKTLMRSLAKHNGENHGEIWENVMVKSKIKTLAKT